MTDRRRYRRVLGWFLLTLVLIQGLGLAFLGSQEHRILLQHATEEMEREVVLIGSLLREPLLKHDYTTVVEFVRRWEQQNPAVVRIRAIAPNGFVLAEHTKEHPRAFTVEASHRITQGQRTLATLQVERDLEDVDAELRRLGLQLALIGALLTAGLGWALWWILDRLGLQPLQQEIARREAVEAELRAHRDRLDEQVTERTRDLQRTVEALQASETALTGKSVDLEEANLELQQLVYVISHDLKGPLRAISHLASVLDEECGELPLEGRATLQVLRARAQRMHALIDALLAYSQSGRHEEVQRVDCGRLAWDIIDSLSAPEGFTFSLEGLPVLVTEHLHLRQTLANLINNAIDHHDRPAGRVQVAAREVGPATWEFSVTDDGPGIAPEFRDKVFEVFQTLAARDQKEHSGMGLALVKKMVENRGGRVSIEAAGERGSVIRFTWPGDAGASRGDDAVQVVSRG